MASRATQLVSIISQGVLEIEEFLKTQDVPELSIEQDVPLSFQGHPKFASAKDAALLACKELSALLGGSFYTITNQTVISYLFIISLLLTNWRQVSLRIRKQRAASTFRPVSLAAATTPVTMS